MRAMMAMLLMNRVFWVVRVVEVGGFLPLAVVVVCVHAVVVFA